MLALAGAALLVISDVLPLYAVVVGTPGEEVRSVAGWSVHAFAMLLFGWFKLVPFVGGLLLLNPFGAAAPPGRLRGPAPERRLLAPGAAGGLPAPA